MTTAGRYYFAREGTPHLEVRHFFGSRDWHDTNNGLVVTLGEQLEAERTWDNGTPPGLLPLNRPTATGDCLSEGSLAATALHPADIINGFNRFCFEPCTSRDEPGQVALATDDCSIQKFYAYIIDRMYADDAAAIGLAFYRLLGPRVTVKFHAAVGLMPAVTTAIGPNLCIIVIDGTRTFQQLALQGMTSLTRPTNIGTYGTVPLWYAASVYVHSIAIADGQLPGTPVILAGHSYGGATALNLAARYRFWNPTRIIRYLTYGCPKTGDQRLHDLVARCQGVNLCNDNDLVTVFPPDRVTLWPVLVALSVPAIAAWADWVRPPNQVAQAADGSLDAANLPITDFDTLATITTQIILGDPIAAIGGHPISEYLARISLRCPVDNWPYTDPCAPNLLLPNGGLGLAGRANAIAVWPPTEPDFCVGYPNQYCVGPFTGITPGTRPCVPYLDVPVPLFRPLADFCHWEHANYSDMENSIGVEDELGLTLDMDPSGEIRLRIGWIGGLLAVYGINDPLMTWDTVSPITLDRLTDETDPDGFCHWPATVKLYACDMIPVLVGEDSGTADVSPAGGGPHDFCNTATTITFLGNGFTPTGNTVVLSSGTANAHSLGESQMLLTLTSAPDPGPLTVIVTNANGVSDEVPIGNVFDCMAPTVTFNDEDLCDDATTVTINGTHIDTTLGNNTVTLNGGAFTDFTLASCTSTSITLTLTGEPPLGALVAEIETVGGGTSGDPVQVATVIACTPGDWLDTFTDPDGTEIEDHMPDESPGGAGYTLLDGELTIIDDKLEATLLGASSSAFAVFPAGKTSYELSIDVTFNSAVDGDSFFFGLRATSGGVGIVVNVGLNAGVWQLFIDDGTSSDGPETVVVVDGTPNTLVVTDDGTDVVATVNGVSVNISSSVSLGTDIQFGLTSVGVGPGGSLAHTLDDLSVTDL